MSIIAWLLFGLVTGVIANAIDPAPSRGGVLGAVILGIVGAFLGGVLGNMLLGVGVTGFNLTSFFVAVAGALLTLFLGRALRRA
jgi:uncharacterized membrane protein YeaQ/YmgE (transglycosylase-associated protein family)